MRAHDELGTCLYAGQLTVAAQSSHHGITLADVLLARRADIIVGDR